MEFRSAVVAIDRSGAAEAMIACVADLVSWGVVEVTLVNVIEVNYGRIAGFGHEEDHRGWLDDTASVLAGSAPELDVGVEVVTSGDTVAAVLDVAKHRGSDLVVVGSRSTGRLRDAFLGSVAAEILRRSTKPVLVERLEPVADDGERCVVACERTLTEVLIATDLSPAASAVEDAAVALAPRADRVTVLHVVDDASGADDVGERLAAIAGRIGGVATDTEVSVERRAGDPTDEIVDRARLGSTLVMTGRTGRGRIAGAVLGRTAAAVARRADVPVLVVPPSE